MKCKKDGDCDLREAADVVDRNGKKYDRECKFGGDCKHQFEQKK